MKNVIIVGSGRSGTSMAAGVLSGAGYFMGRNVIKKKRVNNPYGNFEDREINSLNERLLSQVMLQPEFVDGRIVHRDRPRESQRWLGRIPVGTHIAPLAELEPQIRELTARQPFCFKDPRFSYTLPVWRPFLTDTVFLCVFREPYKTVQSILRQIVDAPHLQGLELDAQSATEVWTLMYRHILEVHKQDGRWLFLHYDQLMSERGQERLSLFTEAALLRTFPDPGLRRQYDAISLPDHVERIYDQLCELAEFDNFAKACH